MKRIMKIGVFFSFMLILSMPIFPSFTIHSQKMVQPLVYNGDHPSVTTITKYEVVDGIIHERTIEIPYDVAIEIKHQFERIDSSSIDDIQKHNMKRNVLLQNDIIQPEERRDRGPARRLNAELPGDLQVTVEDPRGIGLLFSRIEGFFGPSVVNLLSLLVGAPFFISIARGVSIHIAGYFYPSFDFVSFQKVKMSLVGFFGFLIVFPFISVGGYMDGFVLLGLISEQLAD